MLKYQPVNTGKHNHSEAVERNFGKLAINPSADHNCGGC